MGTVTTTSDRLRHILEETEFLKKHSEGTDLGAFLQDHQAQNAFVRCLEVIGDASKKIDPEFRKNHAEIDWENLIARRVKLLKEYWAVDYAEIWHITKNEIPSLADRIEAILRAQ